MSAVRREMRLSAEDTKILLDALGGLPFRRVFALMERLEPFRESAGASVFAVTAAELALCLEALGERPWALVHGVVGSLRQQLRTEEGGD
jgi:hypothetical protein